MASNKQYKQARVNPDFLDLSPDLNIEPDLLIGNGNGIFAAGTQGMGKSVILKRILEECAQKTLCPIVAFDKEQDLIATVEYFPRGMVGTYHNCPSARDILSEGLQVVYDLGTWPNMDIAGQFITRLTNQLMYEADGMPFNLRVPCLLVVDEASYWFPQNRKVSLLAEGTLAGLHNAYESVASRGRKRGLVPMLFTQKFSHVSKEVMSPGTYILLGQNLHTEKRRYMDYVLPIGEFKYYSERQTMQRIGDLQPGEAIVRLSNGEQVVTQFHECRSEHIARTPTAQAARNRYGNMPFERKLYGSFIEDEAMEVVSEPQAPVTKLPNRVTKPGKAKASYYRQVVRHLKKDNTLSASALAVLIGCTESTAKTYRAKYLASIKK
jgi:hypothetical protein